MISIITINYNGLEVTSELLSSLVTVGFSGQLIVVDNGSSHNEATILKDRFPNIHAIRSDQNLGFAGGNNLGIGVAIGDLIMFLNNDTTITEDFTDPVERFFAAHPLAGALSPKIRFEYAADTIQFAGYTELSTITLRNRLIGFREKDANQYPTAKTPYAHGAAMVVRRAVIDQVGLMPERYFLYYEELDWCRSIREAGWEIWYLSEVVVYHKESWSTGRRSPTKSYYLTRNRLIFARKNILSILYQLIISAPVNVVRHLIRRERAQAAAVVKGVRDYVSNH